MAWPCLASHSCALGAQGPCQQPEPVFAYHKAWRRPAGFYFAWGCFSKKRNSCRALLRRGRTTEDRERTSANTPRASSPSPACGERVGELSRALTIGSYARTRRAAPSSARKRTPTSPRVRREMPPGSICVIPLCCCLDLAVSEVEDRARRKTREMARLGRDAHGQEVEDS